MGVLVGQLSFLRTVTPKSRSARAQLLSGFLGRCPKCAKGRIFHHFIYIRDNCETCGLSLRAHDVGDGPAVGATFFVGALALFVTLWVEFRYEPSLWIHVLIAGPIIVLGTLLTLRPLKGMLIAMQYRHRSVEEDDNNLGQM